MINFKKNLNKLGLTFKHVTWVLKSGLPYKRQARKNHEAIFMIKKNIDKKILRDEIKKKSIKEDL